MTKEEALDCLLKTNTAFMETAESIVKHQKQMEALELAREHMVVKMMAEAFSGELIDGKNAETRKIQLDAVRMSVEELPAGSDLIEKISSTRAEIRRCQYRLAYHRNAIRAYETYLQAIGG